MLDPKFTVRQLKAARALLGWSQLDLAEKASISINTIKRLEAEDGEVAGLAATATALRSAIENAGIEFIGKDEGGPGVCHVSTWLRRSFAPSRPFTDSSEAGQKGQDDRRRVAVLVFDDILATDFAIACDTLGGFGRSGVAVFEVRVCSALASVRTSHFDIQGRDTAMAANDAQIVVLPGTVSEASHVEPWVAILLRKAVSDRRKILLCSNAIKLFEVAGLLGSFPALVSWRVQSETKGAISDAAKFFREGDVWVSRGDAAVRDMCLSFIEAEFGEATRVFEQIRERKVTSHSPSLKSAVRDAEDLAPFISWIRENLHRPDLDQRTMAREAGLGLTTFQRRFRAQFETSAMDWLLRERLRSAERLLEETSFSTDEIARKVGFPITRTFTRAFGRTLGLSPSGFRKLRLNQRRSSRV